MGIGDGVFIETENAVITSGDVNSDGKVSLIDAMISFMSVSGKTNLNYYEKCAADLDNNGTVSLSDAMKVFMNIAGKVSI